MKNKKGFTLTEILAVIALIGVLSALVGISVTTSLKKVRKETFKNEVENVYNLALSQKEVDMYNASFENTYDNVNAKLMLNEKNNFDYIVELNNDGEIEYICVYNGEFKIEVSGSVSTSVIKEAPVDSEKQPCSGNRTLASVNIATTDNSSGKGKCVENVTVNVDLGKINSYFNYKYKIDDNEYIDMEIDKNSDSSIYSFGLSQAATITIAAFDGDEEYKILKEEKINDLETEHKITYQNGQTIISDSCCAKDVGSCEVVAPDTEVLENCEFLGWNTDQNATTGIMPGNSITFDKNSTYYAITKCIKTFTATFIAIGETPITKSCQTFSDSCTVVAPTITNPNYGISGWNTNDKAKIEQYTNGSEISLSKNETYYAINLFTANFYLNGSTSLIHNGKTHQTSISVGCKTATSSCNVTTPEIVRSGYTIVGWDTSSSSTTASKAVNTSIALTKNVTYYAITKKNLVTCRRKTYVIIGNQTLSTGPSDTKKYLPTRCYASVQSGKLSCDDQNGDYVGTYNKYCLKGKNGCGVSQYSCRYECKITYYCPSGYKYSGNKMCSGEFPKYGCNSDQKQIGDYCYLYDQTSCNGDWQEY